MNRILQALFMLPAIIVMPLVANMAEGQEGPQAVPTTTVPATVAPETTIPAEVGIPDLTGIDPVVIVAQTEEQIRLERERQITEARLLYGKCGEWHDLAMSVGWPSDQWPTLSFVIFRESRCNIDSWNQSDPSTGSRGLMQINGFWCRPNQYDPNGFLQSAGVLNTCDDLFDAETNLRAGLAIWNYGEEKHGCGWRGPWATPCGKYTVPQPHPGI